MLSFQRQGQSYIVAVWACALYLVIPLLHVEALGGNAGKRKLGLYEYRLYPTVNGTCARELNPAAAITSRVEYFPAYLFSLDNGDLFGAGGLDRLTCRYFEVPHALRAKPTAACMATLRGITATSSDAVGTVGDDWNCVQSGVDAVRVIYGTSFMAWPHAKGPASCLRSHLRCTVGGFRPDGDFSPIKSNKMYCAVPGGAWQEHGDLPAPRAAATAGYHAPSGTVFLGGGSMLDGGDMIYATLDANCTFSTWHNLSTPTGFRVGLSVSVQRTVVKWVGALPVGEFPAANLSDVLIVTGGCASVANPNTPSCTLASDAYYLLLPNGTLAQGNMTNWVRLDSAPTPSAPLLSFQPYTPPGRQLQLSISYSHLPVIRYNGAAMQVKWTQLESSTSWTGIVLRSGLTFEEVFDRDIIHSHADRLGYTAIFWTNGVFVYRASTVPCSMTVNDCPYNNAVQSVYYGCGAASYIADCKFCSSCQPGYLRDAFCRDDVLLGFQDTVCIVDANWTAPLPPSLEVAPDPHGPFSSESHNGVFWALTTVAVVFVLGLSIMRMSADLAWYTAKQRAPLLPLWTIIANGTFVAGAILLPVFTAMAYWRMSDVASPTIQFLYVLPPVIALCVQCAAVVVSAQEGRLRFRDTCLHIVRFFTPRSSIFRAALLAPEGSMRRTVLSGLLVLDIIMKEVLHCIVFMIFFHDGALSARTAIAAELAVVSCSVLTVSVLLAQLLCCGCRRGKGIGEMDGGDEPVNINPLATQGGSAQRMLNNDDACPRADPHNMYSMPSGRNERGSESHDRFEFHLLPSVSDGVSGRGAAHMLQAGASSADPGSEAHAASPAATHLEGGPTAHMDGTALDNDRRSTSDLASSPNSAQAPVQRTNAGTPPLPGSSHESGTDSDDTDDGDDEAGFGVVLHMQAPLQHTPPQGVAQSVSESPNNELPTVPGAPEACISPEDDYVIDAVEKVPIPII